MCIFLQKNSLKKLPLQKKITHTNLETPFFPTNQLIAICMRLPCEIFCRDAPWHVSTSNYQLVN